MKMRDRKGRSVVTCEGNAGRALVRVTLGELVEAVACVTGDLAEQTVVVNHILRTQAGDRRLALRVAASP
jgi:hypothetical protein